MSFDIIHFSGHGNSDRAIFEDCASSGETSIKTLIEEVSRNSQVKCLVLNACHSLDRFKSPALKFYLVGMDSKVQDSAAIEFSRGFYDAIGAGKSIADAIEEGKGCANLKGLREELPIIIINPPLSDELGLL